LTVIGPYANLSRTTDTTSLSSPNRNADTLVTSPVFQAVDAKRGGTRLRYACCRQIVWNSAIRGPSATTAERL